MLKNTKMILCVAALGAAFAIPSLAQEKKPAPTTKPAPAAQTPASKPAPAQTAPATDKAEPYKVGSVVDEKLVLTDLDGKSMTFKELRGKVVAIHFWSTDCPFEITADPKTEKLAQQWKDNKDVVFLAIDSNSTEIGTERPADGYAKIRAHMKERGLSGRVIADTGNKLADAFHATNTPHCFVIDRNGKVVYAGGLDDDPKGEKGDDAKQYFRDAVQATLSGKEVPVKESAPYGCGIKRVKA